MHLKEKQSTDSITELGCAHTHDTNTSPHILLNVQTFPFCLQLYTCMSVFRRKKSNSMTANFQRGEERPKQPRIKTAAFTLDWGRGWGWGWGRLRWLERCPVRQKVVHSQSRHIPRFQVQSQVGVHEESS